MVWSSHMVIRSTDLVFGNQLISGHGAEACLPTTATVCSKTRFVWFSNRLTSWQAQRQTCYPERMVTTPAGPTHEPALRGWLRKGARSRLLVCALLRQLPAWFLTVGQSRWVSVLGVGDVCTYCRCDEEAQLGVQACLHPRAQRIPDSHVSSTKWCSHHIDVWWMWALCCCMSKALSCSSPISMCITLIRTPPQHNQELNQTVLHVGHVKSDLCLQVLLCFRAHILWWFYVILLCCCEWE